jgi:uncharacterized protein (TIGR03435 family)
VAATVAMAGSFAAQDRPRLAFETATIRPSVPGRPSAQRVLPTRIDFVNTPLRTVFFAAFRFTDPTEASFPDWMTNARFDMQATYPAGATAADVPDMLQSLLRDRFGLRTHIEPRRVEGYELVVGKDGIKMREVEPVDELDRDFTKEKGPRLSNEIVSERIDGKARQILIPDEIGWRAITSRSFYEVRTTPNRTQRIDAVRISMGEFATLLRLNLGRPVFDKTGLVGVYQFKTELDQLAMPIVMIDRDGNPIGREPTGVSTFNAVEALGLRLQELRGPVDVVVVDSINREPTEN